MSGESASLEFIPYMPPSTAVIEVHNVLGFSDKFLWSGHVVFVALAVVALGFILLARGPRRSDANAEAAVVAENSTQPSAPVTPNGVS